MAYKGWILPILIGIVSSVLILTILYNNSYIKSKFSDLGALIQLETSRPAYYGIGWVPENVNYKLPPVSTSENITSFISPLYINDPLVYPVYNYYPQIPINPISIKPKDKMKENNTQQTVQDLAFSNPSQTYDPHKAYYWGLSGGYPYPYPFPMMYLPSTNMDKVKGVEDKIL